MNILATDYDGSALPRSKSRLATTASDGAVAERFQNNTIRTQNRLLSSLDRALARSVEERLKRLLGSANRREARAKVPEGIVACLSRLHRPVEEMASEARDFTGWCRITPLSAHLRGLTGLTLFRSPFVRASLHAGGLAEPATSTASGPACLNGGPRPSWKTKAAADDDGRCGGDDELALCLPLPDHMRMRPIFSLRLEVLAMDGHANLLPHVLLGAVDLQYVVQPSRPTRVAVPLYAPAAAAAADDDDDDDTSASGRGVRGGGRSEVNSGNLVVEITVVRDESPSLSPPDLEAKRKGAAGIAKSQQQLLQPLIWTRICSSRGANIERSSSSSSQDGTSASFDDDETDDSDTEGDEEDETCLHLRDSNSSPAVPPPSLSSFLPLQPQGGAWVLRPSAATTDMTQQQEHRADDGDPLALVSHHIEAEWNTFVEGFKAKFDAHQALKMEAATEAVVNGDVNNERSGGEDEGETSPEASSGMAELSKNLPAILTASGFWQ